MSSDIRIELRFELICPTELNGAQFGHNSSSTPIRAQFELTHVASVIINSKKPHCLSTLSADDLATMCETLPFPVDPAETHKYIGAIVGFGHKAANAHMNYRLGVAKSTFNKMNQK